VQKGAEAGAGARDLDAVLLVLTAHTDGQMQQKTGSSAVEVTGAECEEKKFMCSFRRPHEMNDR